MFPELDHHATSNMAPDRTMITSYKALCSIYLWICNQHDDVIKWKHFPCYWPFVRGIHRSPVIPPPKGQCHRALMFSLICVLVNDREAGDLSRYRTHYEVNVMYSDHSVAIDSQDQYHIFLWDGPITAEHAWNTTIARSCPIYGWFVCDKQPPSIWLICWHK